MVGQSLAHYEILQKLTQMEEMAAAIRAREK